MINQKNLVFIMVPKFQRKLALAFSSQYQNHHSIRVCHDTISIFLIQIIIKKSHKVFIPGFKNSLRE